MPAEIASVSIVIVLGLLQLVLQAGEYRRVHGVAYANSAQDTPPATVDSPLLGRLTRALRNLNETLPFFLGAVLVLVATQTSTAVTAGSALVYAGARVIYLPLYAFGVPYVRGLVWTVSFVALATLVFAAVGAVAWNGLAG